MLHPFAPLSRELLEAFVRAGKKYFVRQTYTRVTHLPENGVKGYFIVTHYSEMGQAQHHLGAISHDPNAFVYNWNIEADRQKLLIAASKPCGYKVYASVFEADWRKHLTGHLKSQVKKYIDYSLAWRPARGDTVQFEIFTNYGELYARLKLGRQEARIKLADIEKI